MWLATKFYCLAYYTNRGFRSVLSLDVTAILERSNGRHVCLLFSAMRPSALWFCIDVCSLNVCALHVPVLCFPNRRLISRFGCGCHGLHVHSATPPMTECAKFACVEDEHHFW